MLNLTCSRLGTFGSESSRSASSVAASFELTNLGIPLLERFGLPAIDPVFVAATRTTTDPRQDWLTQLTP
jgi:hypothetical protein